MHHFQALQKQQQLPTPTHDFASSMLFLFIVGNWKERLRIHWNKIHRMIQTPCCTFFEHG
jgi:hypothetical protein